LQPFFLSVQHIDSSILLLLIFDDYQIKSFFIAQLTALKQPDPIYGYWNYVYSESRRKLANKPPLSSDSPQATLTNAPQTLTSDNEMNCISRRTFHLALGLRRSSGNLAA